MKPFVIDIDVVDADPNGLAESQTPAAGGAQALTLNGALISGGTYTAADHAHRIGVTPTGDESARTYTIVGTDQNGVATTEVLAGLNATITESVAYFKTVSSITVDANTAGALIAGTVDEVCTPDIPMDWTAQIAANMSVDVTGTINFTIQESFTPINDPTWTSLFWVSITALASKTADTTSTGTPGHTAMRVVINSYSSGAELQVYVTQPRNH
jgi:hypothetical protein